jgi:hypothetical protein
MAGLRFRPLALSIRPMIARRHLVWIAAAALFSAAVLPFLVYYTGTVTLGPYGGGAGRFYADFYADLARLRPGSWLLLLGPVVLVIAWRTLVAYAWPETGK